MGGDGPAEAPARGELFQIWLWRLGWPIPVSLARKHCHPKSRNQRSQRGLAGDDMAPATSREIAPAQPGAPAGAAVTAGVAQTPVIERLEIQELGGGGWGWRGSTVAEPKGNAKLREVFRRAHGDVVRLTVKVWWSDGAQVTPESAWEEAELVLEVPSRKAPELFDLIAAGLFERAFLKDKPVEQPEWRSAQRFLGKSCDEEAGRRHIARCLKPTIRRDRGYVPTPVSMPAAEAEPARSRNPPPAQVLVLAVRIGGLPTPWFRRRIERDGQPSDPDAEAIRHIRDTVSFGSTRLLRIELTLPGDRLYCFPLRYGGGIRLPSLLELAEAHCRRRPHRPLLPSHRRVLTHLANVFAGKAELDNFQPDPEVLAATHPPLPCRCGRTVPVHRALVAGFPVLVLAAHAPGSAKAAWTGLCIWVDRIDTDLDPAPVRELRQPLPDRSEYASDRNEWWADMRRAVRPELGPIRPVPPNGTPEANRP